MSQTEGAVLSRVWESIPRIRTVTVVRVFVAGGTGVLGRRLVPQLVARGHQVTATTTSPARLGQPERLGAEAVVMDGLDAVSVGEAVARARPEVIVHQMTGISMALSPKQQAGHVASAFFVVLYAAVSTAVIGIGIAAQNFGLRQTGIATAVIIAALAAICAGSLAALRE